MDVTGDLERGARAVNAVLGRLERPADLEARYAAAVLAAARRGASSAPSPQAGAVASGLSLSGGMISVADRQVLSGGGTAADMFWGAERGSSLYRQFGPRVAGGAWWTPALEDETARAEADAWADDLFRSVT